jgi:pimeloyl-ACP methyl ester carboxylesterase
VEATGLLFGLTVNEAASYLHPGPAALLERRATSYARLLQAHGQRSVQLAGRGFGALLALDLARQLTEMGVDVLAMTLLDPRALIHTVDDAELAPLFELEMGGVPAWPEIDRITDEAMLLRMFADTVRASLMRKASPYLGDVTVVHSGAGTHAGGPDWGSLILGELRQVTLGTEPSDAALASLVFAPAYAPRALP